MRRHFEDSEDELKQVLLNMGGLAEEMIHLAVKVLLERTKEPSNKIYADESEVNKLHMEIDDKCIKLLALQQPTAQDLRFITCAMKINSDLERIGDQAVNVLQTSTVLLEQPQMQHKLFDISHMAELASSMLHDSLDAFVRKDMSLAESVLKRDDEEDKLKRETFNELLQLMQEDSSIIHRALDLILISRNLERIADHATNIAEDVIFMTCGKDIRHHAE